VTPRDDRAQAKPRAHTGPLGVSVIIPAYEGWRTLRRTLAAVLHDARSLGAPWEVIVVDNESHASLAERVRALADRDEPLHVFRRTGLRGRHFAPGSARNVGIQMAEHDCLVFLDADCIPAPGTLAHYRELVGRCVRSVFLGHREFVDAAELDATEVAHDRSALQRAPRVRSVSNYGVLNDRRLPELAALEGHPRPYDCLFSCNFALHRACLGQHRFEAAYDGYWGYEDIDLGLRLHQDGRRFVYAADAFVYHQEGDQVSLAERKIGRARNLRLLDSRCPGFIGYRMVSGRAGSSTAALGALSSDTAPRAGIDTVPQAAPFGVNLLPVAAL
jgi:glycosyltransferase involved in cell wall biosynthesis